MRITTMAIAWVWAGCSGTGATGGKDAWWVLDTTQTGPVPGEGGEGDFDEDEEDEEEDGTFAELAGFGTYDGSTFAGEIIVEVWEKGQARCILFTEATGVASAGCPDCEAGLVLTTAGVEVEVDEACAERGVPPSSLEGTVEIGWSGEALWLSDDGWVKGGEVFMEDGYLEWFKDL